MRKQKNETVVLKKGKKDIELDYEIGRAHV